jgi:hypothetical protein
MATRTARSLHHEYQLYIEQEIENYKESVPRPALLAIGDEAASRLAAEPQFALTEMLLCEEVDRIIFSRLRLPAYNTWRKRRLKLQQELRRPEHWGLSASDALVRSIGGRNGIENHGLDGSGGHVLVAGEAAERSALFLAANGCDVTALESREDSVRRVMEAAIQAGLAERVHAVAAELTHWTPPPGAALQAVVCSHSALCSLSSHERARVLAVLQSATRDGGVHLVETIVAGSSAIEELRATYSGWNVSVEPSKATADADAQVFLARKEQAIQ